MSRRQRLDPSTRRVLLLDAAERAFGRYGVEHTRVEDVALEANVATGLLYRHFPSKEALLDALMERRAARFDERLRTRIQDLGAAGLPAEVLVVEGLRVWLDQLGADVAEGRWVPRTEPAPCIRFREKTREFVTNCITEIAPSVDLSVASIVTAALEGAAEAAAHAWHNSGEPIDPQNFKTLVSAFCLGGLDHLARLLGVDISFDLATANARGTQPAPHPRRA